MKNRVIMLSKDDLKTLKIIVEALKEIGDENTSQDDETLQNETESKDTWDDVFRNDDFNK